MKVSKRAAAVTDCWDISCPWVSLTDRQTDRQTDSMTLEGAGHSVAVLLWGLPVMPLLGAYTSSTAGRQARRKQRNIHNKGGGAPARSCGLRGVRTRVIPVEVPSLLLTVLTTCKQCQRQL